jgi:hypothetical protein
VRYQREYKGFQVEASAVASKGRYICSVILTRGETERCFDMPPSIEFSSERKKRPSRLSNTRSI